MTASDYLPVGLPTYQMLILQYRYMLFYDQSYFLSAPVFTLYLCNPQKKLKSHHE